MYSVFRIQKFKRGDVFQVLREAQRTPDIHFKKGVDYDNDIDWTKTCNNVHLVDSTLHGVGEVMREAGVKPRNKDSVVLVGAIISASPEYFSRDNDGNWIYDDKAKAFGEDARRLVVQELCGGDASRLVSFQAHLDEGSIHFHALVVPIVEENGEKKLSAKALLNGRQRMRQLQDQAFEILGKPRGFDRGELVDLDKPSKSQKRHKTTGQYRDERAQAALDKIIEAGEHLDKEDVALLVDLKDAAFGRGKILPPDKYNKVVEILRTLEAFPEAVAALKELRTQADKDGRIKTLQGRLDNGHAKAKSWAAELSRLRPMEQENQAFERLLRTMRVDQERTALDLWQQAKRLQSFDGEVNFSNVVDCFARLYKNIKSDRNIYRGYDSHDFPSIDNQDGPELY